MERSLTLRQGAAALLVVATAWYLASTIHENWAELRAYEWRLDPGLLIASLAAHVAVLAWGVFVWSRALGSFAGPPVSYSSLLKIWSISNAARYIPGTVWQFVAAAEAARGAGVSRVRMLASLAIHIGSVLLAATAVALLTLPLTELGYPGVAGAAVLLPAFVILVHPKVLNGALGLLARVSRRDVLRWEGTWTDGLFLLGLQVVSWLLYGCAFWLFLRSVAPFGLETLLPAAGVNAASFVVGWVVFLAPGGAGFREAAMTFLLGAYVPVGVAAVIAILSRLWSIAAEILIALLALVLARKAAPRVPPAPGA